MNHRVQPTYPRAWSKDEVNTLWRYYPYGGVNAVLPYLDRSVGSIYVMVAKLKVPCYINGGRRDKQIASSKRHSREQRARKRLQPLHCHNFKQFSDDWYKACHDAFVAAMLQAYPNIRYTPFS